MTDSKPPLFDFVVSIEGFGSHHVRASYFREEAGLIVFKDDQAKSVFACEARRLLAIHRADAVGTARG